MMRSFCFVATDGNKAIGEQKGVMKTNHTKRGGLASRLKRLAKRLARNALVRRWLLLAVLKIVSWLAKRLWSDNDHSNLSS